jgi:hypothetical protein
VDKSIQGFQEEIMAGRIKNAERKRLDECGFGLDLCQTEKAPWKKWGPYLSERQWGTVREDYSDNGDAWNYFSHDCCAAN